MKTSIHVLIIFAATILLSSLTHHYPFMTLKEKGMKGPVHSVTDNFYRPMLGGREIQFHRFDQSGRLVEVRHFLPQFEIAPDSIMTEIVGKYTTIKKWLNPNYRGLDTNMFRFSYSIVYKYDDQSNMISNEMINEDGLSEWKNRYQYDLSDSLVGELHYFFDTLGQVVDSSRTNYEYSNRENVQIVTQTSKKDSFVVRTERVLDNNGRILISRSYSNDTSIARNASESFWLQTYTYKYDSLLESAEQFIVDPPDTVKFYDEKRTYNSIGQLISKSKTRFIDGEKISTDTQIYTYHPRTDVLSKWRKIEENHTFGSDPTFEESEHNQYGDLITLNTYEEGDTSIYTSSYVYDNHFNWIELIWLENGVALDTTRRLITYYE